MAKWKDLPKTAVLRKGYQVYYGKDNFGFYVKMQKVHISIPKKESCVAPFGCKRGQNMVGLWNPHALANGNPSEANVYIPKNQITKIRKEIK